MPFRPLVAVLPFLATVLLAGTTGCSAEDPWRPELLGEADQAIAGGYADTEDTAVVGIYDSKVGALCTGSIIAPNVVLTARHCVSSVENTVNGGVSCLQTTFGPLGAASNFYVTTKSELTSNQSDYHAVREVVGLPTDGYVCGNDQVILILTDDIDPNEAVPLVPRIDVPIAAGDEYYAVGYGGTNDSGAGAGARRRRDTLFVDCVAGDCPNYLVKDSEWLGDIGICHGDSGGPSLDLENRVIGVTSRGSVGCDSPVYGYVLTWAQWLKDTTVYATGLGGYPAPPWSTGYPTDPQYSMPIGDLCAVPADCKSNGCLHDGIGSYCTRLCNDAAPCPEGYTCDQENLGVCVRVYPDPVPLPADDEAGAETSCAVGRRPGADPTKPVPWLTIAVIAALARLRRRR